MRMIFIKYDVIEQYKSRIVRLVIPTTAERILFFFQHIQIIFVPKLLVPRGGRINIQGWIALIIGKWTKEQDS